MASKIRKVILIVKKIPFLYYLALKILKIYYLTIQFIPFLIKKTFYFFNYEICFQVKKSEKSEFNSLNLNIGCGDYVIPGFLSLDFFSPYYYKNKKNFYKERIEYDIRNDLIPFKSNQIDNIYISHVIEHIETEFVITFLKESLRVLKKGGVLRISCPDADFLFQVSQFKNTYWNWRKDWFKNRGLKWGKITPKDCLIRELATPKLSLYDKRIMEQTIDQKIIDQWKYESLMKNLKKGLHFRFSAPGDHINSWDFKTLKNLGKEIGFSRIIRSKYRGSVSSIMQSPYFDQTRPGMSLYVEFIK